MLGYLATMQPWGRDSNAKLLGAQYDREEKRPSNINSWKAGLRLFNLFHIAPPHHEPPVG